MHSSRRIRHMLRRGLRCRRLRSRPRRGRCRLLRRRFLGERRPGAGAGLRVQGLRVVEAGRQTGRGPDLGILNTHLRSAVGHSRGSG